MPSPASLSRPQRAGAMFAGRPAATSAQCKTANLGTAHVRDPGATVKRICASGATHIVVQCRQPGGGFIGMEGMKGWSQAPRVARSSRMVTCAMAGQSKNVLMMGGTRFIGQYLARMLVDQGHDVTLYTRGKSPIASKIPDDTDEEYAAFSASVKHITGDRKDLADVRSKLTGSGFDVVYDINGREAAEAEPILDALPNLQQYIYCSSAGVYLKSPEMPHRETDAVDPKSRHKGKLDTESLLQQRSVNYTSIRPVYIYGPLNYNPVEEFCFQRIAAGRPICVPGSGMQLTQMGHVKDLATAFVKVLGNDKAARQIYNISGERFVTFDGFARLCAEAMEAPEPELVHFNPKEFDFGKKKAFPMRDQHFFASIDKAMADLDWVPEFDLLEGLKDSYSKDFGRGTYRKEPDFTADDMVLSRLRGRVMV